MTTTNKILPVALVAALLGGSVGAFVMRPSRQVETTDETRVTSPATVSRNLASNSDASGEVLNVADKSEVASSEAGLSADERDCYRDGFNDGIKAARENRSNVSTVTRYAPAPAASRVVYRPAARTRYARSNNTRRVYYDYNQQPRSRSFWSKHRDKLTVAAGTGAGAIIGGLIGGKKGAAIGALGGAGGSALYTYKLRKRNRNY
jgi:hypothetical protein